MTNTGGDVMSTPINELANESENENNIEQNISENIMKNYETINQENDLQSMDSKPQYDPIPPPKLNKPSKSNKKVNNSNVNNNVKNTKSKCTPRNTSLMCYFKPALIVFMIMLLFCYPLFDTKILKLIPKTLNQYDNITLIGLIVKALLGSLLFSVGYKFI